MLPLLGALAACVSNPSLPSGGAATANDREAVQNYRLGESATAAVGEAMIEKGERFYIEQSSDHLSALLSREQGGFSITQGGSYPIKARDNADGGFYVGREERKDVAVKIDDAGRLLSPYVHYLREGRWQRNTIFAFGETGEAVFEPVQTERQVAAQSKRHTVVYRGLVDEFVKLSYREFEGAANEPSVEQDLSFNLAERDVIRFSNYRIQITGANAEAINYIVLTD